MPSRRLQYDSSSSDSSYHARRRLPSPPPSGILRNANRHVTIVDPATISRRVDRITDNLVDTHKNLESVDSKMSTFKDVHNDSMSALTKLQEDLEGSIHRLRNTREKRTFSRDAGSLRRSELNRRSASTSRVRDASSPFREYDSDTTARGRPSSSHGVSSRRFGDGDFSSTTRDRLLDLSASQNRMEQDLNDEISRRLKSEKDTNRTIQNLSASRKQESATERVERRLKQIERGLENDRSTATQVASQVAQDLLTRSQTSRPTDDDSATRARLLQMETNKRSVENELEMTRRRLEQSEGGREALVSQIGELRAMINRSDKERSELQKQIQKQEAEHKARADREAQDRLKLAASDRADRERSRQEGEIEELRAALKRSAGVVQLDDLRRDLEKSERQRQHLSDHIEVLTKDLEKKEQSNTRILHQLNELQRDFDESERERDRICRQLEDALVKVKEQARDGEKYSKNMLKLEEGRNDCEREKEELRSAAQETIRQWKTKCRKQETEFDRLRENVDQINSKNDQLVKDAIASKTQANNAFQQCENLRKEMEDLIAKRVELDEELRRRDNELEQTNEEKRSLMRNVQDMTSQTEKLESKLRDTNEKASMLTHKLGKTEEDKDSLKSMLDMSKNQTTSLQRELRELKLLHAELESSASSERNGRLESEKLHEDSRKQINAMQLEINSVHKQMHIERETHKKELQNLNSAIHSGEVERMEAVQRVGRKADDERLFLEGEIHRVNMECNEAKAANRDAQKLLSKAKDELSALEGDTARAEGEVKTWKEKFQLVQSSYENKCAEACRSSGRASKLEEDLLWSRDELRRLEEELERGVDGVRLGVQGVEEVIGVDGGRIGTGRDGWAAAIQRRLEVVKKEILLRSDQRDRALQELDKHKIQMKELYRSMEDDRRSIMSEVTQQNKLVDSLSKEKTSLLLENKEARMIVQDLEDRVSNLTADLETSKSRRRDAPLVDITSKVVNKEESKKERERIEERYNRYKSTITSLQADLEEKKGNHHDGGIPMRMGRSPSPIKRVTISESPTIHGYSIRPRSSSPKVYPEKDR